jgi:hypothetical protein
MRAWADPSVKALVALRAATAARELLPLLHHLRPALAPKLFIGYSDTTALLSWLTCAGGVAGAARSDDRRAPLQGAEGYDERSFLSAVRGESGVELVRRVSPRWRSGGRSLSLGGRTMAMLVAVARHALRVHAAGVVHLVPSRT